MKTLVFLLCVIAAARCLGQENCAPIRVPAEVAIAGTDVTLADLLVPPICPSLQREARQVHLGSAPLPGSVRVLPEDELRSALRKLRIPSASETWWQTVALPARVSIRPKAALATCSEMAERLLADPLVRDRMEASTSGSYSPSVRPEDVACGAAGRIAAAARLAFHKVEWNAASRSWEILASCVRATDCVPFLIRIRSSQNLGQPITVPREEKRTTGQERVAMVRRGQRATLVWEQSGIRLEVPVVCLEAGGQGGAVKVRISGSNKIVNAVVTAEGRVHAGS